MTEGKIYSPRGLERVSHIVGKVQVREEDIRLKPIIVVVSYIYVTNDNISTYPCLLNQVWTKSLIEVGNLLTEYVPNQYSYVYSARIHSITRLSITETIQRKQTSTTGPS